MWIFQDESGGCIVDIPQMPNTGRSSPVYVETRRPETDGNHLN